MHFGWLTEITSEFSQFELQWTIFFASTLLFALLFRFEDHLQHSSRSGVLVVLLLIPVTLYGLVCIYAYPVSIPCGILLLLIKGPIEASAVSEYKSRLANIARRELSDTETAAASLKHDIADLEKQKNLLECELSALTTQIDTLRSETRSSTAAIPYMAKIIADFDTRNLEILARQLEWGNNQERKKKVRSLRELRKETSDMVAQYKEAEYKLAYAIAMFPDLEIFLDADSQDVPELHLSDLADDASHDRVRNFLSAEEYRQLPSTVRNQLALDRYIESHRKSNWQIGRDYELYVGYRYEKKGYKVEYYGSINKLEDLGRDLIARRDGTTLIIQCKYWSAKKQIHEKHINQLYGTMMCYCFENNVPVESVRGLLVTNITLSETARKFAKYLGIEVVENYTLGNYPRIKCNINHDEFGEKTKIYHLPFDQQYDSCKINSPGEFMAMTVEEAEKAGFRRAYRWHSN